MSQQIQSLANESSSQFSSTMSFPKEPMMKLRNRITFVRTLTTFAIVAATFTATASHAATFDFDFSEAVAGSVTDVVASGSNKVYTITDPDAGAYTLTLVGSPRNEYDADRGGGYRNNSANAENDQNWSFAVTGLAAGFEVTEFGLGYVYALGSSTFTLDITNNFDATSNSQSGINSPPQPNQTNNNMLGITGNFGNSPTFNAFIDENGTTASVLQLNGMRITVAPPVPEPSALMLAVLGVVGLVGTRRRRRR